MKKWIVVVVFVLALAMNAAAQDKTPEFPAKESAKKVELDATAKLAVREAQLRLERLKAQQQQLVNQYRDVTAAIAEAERNLFSVAADKLKAAGGDPEKQELNDALEVKAKTPTKKQ